MKKILLITYHFPPSPAVGGNRALNFAKKLPQFGWEPYVLTIDDKYLPMRDDARLEEAGGTRIIRTSLLPTLTQLYLAIKGLFKALPAERPAAAQARDTNTPPADEGMARRARRFIISIFLGLPDMERNWIIPATIRAVRMIKRERIDCVLTTAPPVSVHLTGLLVKLFTGVKWVADYRDPWLAEHGKRIHVNTALSLRIERGLELKVLEKADLVTFNTKNLRDDYVRKYGLEPGGKFVYIPNGFDPGFFSSLNGLKKFDRFTLTYTGSLYIGRSPEPVFEALSRLFADDSILPGGVKVKLVGECRNVDGRPIESIIESYGLGSVVEVLDRVPHHDALRLIRQSHLALLFAPNTPFQIPGKIYEYMGAGTTVLGLMTEGATADLISATGIGRAYRPTDIDGITAFIRDSINSTESGPKRARHDLSRFHIDNITKELVEQIENH